MVKKSLCGILTLIMLLLIIPVNTYAAGPDAGTLQISSLPAGADVYIDGNFTKSVTPCELELPAGTHKVELKIKGYGAYSNESVQINAGGTTALSDIKQLPDLTETDADHTITITTLQDKVRWSDVSGMNSINVAQLKADTGTPISLREAIQAVKNEPAENGHYRIEFDASLKGGTLSLFKPGEQKFPVEDWMLQNLYIEKRGNMTINGDIDRDGVADITLEPYTNGSPSSPKGSVLNIYASDVTLAGIIFKGDEALSYSTLIFRVPDKNTEKYDVDNVRILGCTLDHSQGTGVATCGAYGYGGTSYGGAGTTNFTDFVFSGNTFTKTFLFSFAGAGDEDYNVIDGYYICANRFYNGKIGMLAADAHTWYVYGSNDPNGNGGVAGQVEFCEHNQLKNIYVTGNYFEHTENADIIIAATANQGNSNNILENLYIRNNTSIVAEGIESGVLLENVGIGRDDRYTSDQLTHNTANNTMRNVYIENNDFEIGDKKWFEICNIQGGCVRDSYMDGTGNLMENVQIKGNRIECDMGTFITNITGYSGTINDDVSDNTMRNIVVSGNEFTGVDTDWMASGLVVTNHNNIMNSHIPSYHDNTMSDIDIENNTVSGYQKGITVAGSLGNGVNAHSIEDVTVSGNTVTCKADGEFGIIAAGCSVDAYGGDAYNGSTNCEAKDITISGNNITAPGGILLVGTYVNAPVKGSLEGNKISAVSAFSNTITKSEGSNVNRPLPGITAADIIEPWPRVETGTKFDNSSCGQPDIHDNTISGFICDVFDMSDLVSSYPIGSPKTAEVILSDFKAATEAVFGGNSMDWNWYGDSFSSAAAKPFTAAARRIGQIGFDYLYQCVNTTDEYYVRFDIGSGTRTGGGALIQSVKSGEDAEEPVVTPPDGYSFDGWDKAFTNVTEPLTVNAVYTSLGSKPVESVTLNSHSAAMTVGDTLSLTAAVLPEDATHPEVTWSSDKTSVATVDQTGKVTAVGTGTAVITATTDSKSDTCTVTVQPRRFTVTASANNASFGSASGGGTYDMGMTVTLHALPNTGYHFVRWLEGSTPVSADVDYSFTVDSVRVLTAEFEINQYLISVSANDAAYGTVKGEGRCNHGDSVTLTATPNSGFRFVRWTEAGSEVSRNASYSFIATKNTALTAKFAPLMAASISCTKKDATLYGGSDGSVTVIASGGDSGSYQYSINGGASWQDSGYFGGLSAGTYIAAVRDAGYPENMATCTVNVGQPAYVGAISAVKMSAKANAGTAITIVPPAAPKGYTIISVTYTSTTPAVAAVDSSGNVTFIAGGKATIITKIVSQTVDIRGRVKTKTITIKKTITVKQLVQSISLNLYDTTIARTQKVKLTVSFAPATAISKKVKWTSSNPKVAAISSSGVVAGKAGGTAVITCRALDGSNVSASCTVTVTPVYPTGIKLSKTSLMLKPGKTTTLKATVLPKNTDFKTVMWSSSNPSVAAVDAKGKVRALAPGSAVITATTSNGYSASCAVTIK